MSAAIAATPVSALAASNSSQQVHAGYEASDMANDESDVNEEIIPEEATPEADTQEVVIPETDTQEKAAQEAEVEEADVPETAAQEADVPENVQTEEAVVPEEAAEAANVTSWTDLQEAINQAAKGDVITLAADINAESGNTMLVIPEGKQLTIDMQGHVINRNLSSLNNNGHVFQINAGAQLTILNGSVTGGYANDGGGICNYGTVYATNVSVYGNKISNENASRRGAGIYNNGTMTLTDCAVYDNSGNDGGGIYNDTQKTLTMDKVSLEGNTSVNHGGGGLVNYGHAYLTDCEVAKNTAKGDGGGIWSTQYVAMNRCIVDGNNSASAGGGICIKNGSMDFADSSVTNNASADGGGIYVSSASAAVNAIGTSEITGNTSRNHGGGGITNYGTLKADGSLTITGNQAKNNGGGLWNNGTFSVNGHVCIDTNKSETTNHNNLYLPSKKVITVAGPLDSTSRIVVSGADMPGTYTSGWSAKNPSGDLNVIGFEYNAFPVLVDGEVSISCTYMARTVNPATMQVEEKEQQVPETLKAFPARISEGGWFAVMDSSLAAGRLTVPAGKTVNLVLMDGTGMILNGFYVEPGGTLNIYGQKNDTGKLVCKARKYQAGIGSNDETAHGTINIYGGTIDATGGDYGAGIGMGDQCDDTCGKITVYGGTIDAQGGTDAAGIGGGNEGRGAKINIYGGTVTGTGGKFGAGIGAGDDRGLDYVGIYGGTVNAYGGKFGAGIGEGYSADYGTSNGTICIEGGKIEAIGNSGGAGIGGGAGNNTRCTILIKGGNIDASSQQTDTPTDGGAGIGCGTFYGFDGGGDFRGLVRITGGTVKATGGGHDNGLVDAYVGAAGIGGGNEGDMEGTIEITGGMVTAIGRYGGAAIGAGPSKKTTGGDFSGSVIIDGGSVELYNATGLRAEDDKKPHYIGSGFEGIDKGTLTLGDQMNVWYAWSRDPVAKAARDSTCRSFNNSWLYIE